MRALADECLDGLADMARVEARFAALKVLVAAAYVRATDAMAAPAVTLLDAKCQEMAVTAEVACVLTVGAGTAGAFLGDCLALTNRLPLTLAALSAGTISWAHARVMVDETANLDPAGAAALEAHFLDPDAPNPARGCPAGDLVPYRFRSKVRTWRERHHPDSIEQRHTKSAKDRRVEFRPDSDGMAWFSAYLPADTAAGIWDRTTASYRLTKTMRQNTPPGWTSPSGRYYPSEQQDWEPPNWPPGILETFADPNADAELDAAPDPDIELDRGLPPDPWPEQEQELPEDPFPGWHLLAPRNGRRRCGRSWPARTARNQHPGTLPAAIRLTKPRQFCLRCRSAAPPGNDQHADEQPGIPMPRLAGGIFRNR